MKSLYKVQGAVALLGLLACLLVPAQVFASRIGHTITIPVTLSADDAFTAVDMMFSVIGGDIADIDCAVNSFVEVIETETRCVTFSTTPTHEATFALLDVTLYEDNAVIDLEWTASTADGTAPAVQRSPDMHFRIVENYEGVPTLYGHGDINGDGYVNAADLGMFMSRFDASEVLPSSPTALQLSDLNQDGAIDVNDLGMMADVYGLVYWL